MSDESPTGQPPTPMLTLVRECIQTPCRSPTKPSCRMGGSPQLHISPTRRGRSSSKANKAVTFEDAMCRETRSRSTSPRKALAQKDENARPFPPSSIAIKPHGKKLKEHKSTVVVEPATIELDGSSDDRHSPSHCALLETLEEREAEIGRLTNLVTFLATEVKIYTTTLEQEVARQDVEIARLTGVMESLKAE